MRTLFTIFYLASKRARHGAWSGRRPLNTYRHTHLQFLRLLDHWYGYNLYVTHRWFFPQLKTLAKVCDNDARWAAVVSVINSDRAQYAHVTDQASLPIENRLWPLFTIAPTVAALCQ